MPRSKWLSVTELFEKQVSKNPENIAVVEGDRQLTYRELSTRANQVCNYLRKFGVTCEVVIGIHLERSIDALIAILGVLKAGAPFLPLDLKEPRERLKFMLDQTDADFVLTKTPDDLDFLRPRQIRRWSELDFDTLDPVDMQIGIEPPYLAYIIYTSGSTGEPKGVEIDHLGFPNMVLAQREIFEITPKSRVLQFSALHFDASIYEIFMALLNGATLYMANDELRYDPQGLTDFIEKNEITIAMITPAFLVKMPLQKKPVLKTLAVIADTCPKEVKDRWLTQCRVLNVYGPTEATVCTTVFVYDGIHNDYIGKPLANVTCSVLDETGKPVPLGEVGELYIGGVGVGRGYRAQEELRDTFFFEFHKRKKVTCFYRTGDKVREHPDGNFEYLGRVDYQIKFNGVRLDPVEIETALNQHREVQQSLVALKEPQTSKKKTKE